ncbi:MAG: DNA replication complex GINS family protein [Thermoplasmata archaeon]|nr:DNA replication complex GINS family protein [Thermoplasmata archaeon]
MADLYGRLLDWRRSEAGGRGLAKLPSDFYALARSYLAEARRTFEAELRENPGGRKGELARQTHQRASQLARDIAESRMNKVLTSAYQAAVGGARELPNAVAEERELFDRLVETLRKHRQDATPYLEGMPSGGAPAGPAPTPPPPLARPAAAAAAPPPAEAELPRVAFVRVLRSSPPLEIAGETIELRAEDLLSLPPEVARILVEGRVAERVDAPDLDGRAH